ncbi:FimV/HubP family polar landmark protein [Pseudomonas aeruginosa]|uniref:FimV/HubP family polar landmark protein n=1 Tax=Pseudomonas aeruginosa TaxID=287 RepID=UPI003524B03B
MVRLRTLVRAIAAASVLTSGMAHGLGLGEITLKSALNQPLDAEIELLEVRDLGSGEVIPSLASPEEFSKAGVDRLYYLTDLKFTPVVKPNGKSVIRVTSSKPVQEPYLNFLVQVLWPNGRLLREYTVLLDPPLYSPQVAAVAPQVEKTTAQTSDALGEADIYIAYGRFNQAAELLQNAIYDEPQRTDLRLKLMEVYAEMGDREGFARQENELREIGGAQPQVEQLKSRYPAMVAVAAVAGLAGAKLAQDELDSFSLDDLSLDDSGHAAKPDAAGQDLDDAFDLSLDDLGGDDVQADLKSDSGALDDLTLDSDLDLAASTPADKPVDDLDFGLDFAELAETPSQPKHDDLGDFSLDLDAPEDKLSDDDFLLSLNDEVPAAAPADNEFTLDTEAAEEPALSLPDDFDLSLADEPTEPAAPEKGEDSFAAQLDEVSAQLDELASNLDEPKSATPSFSAEDAAVASALDGDADDDFDFLSGADEAATKLDLARAYIDMGDSEGARDILDEVLAEGNDSQQAEARELLERLA